MRGVYHHNRKKRYRSTVYVIGQSENLVLLLWFDGQRLQLDLAPICDLEGYKKVA